MNLRTLLLLLVVMTTVVSELSAQLVPAPPAGNVPPIFKFNRRKPDPQPIPETIKQSLTLYFQTLSKGGPEVKTAYAQLLKGTRLAERQENVDVLSEKTIQAIAAYGPVVDFELYDTQRVGKRLLGVTYLGWHQLQPLQWRFVYYLPGDLASSFWTLIDVRVSDNLEDLLE